MPARKDKLLFWYLESTSIHGLRYLGSLNSLWFDKLTWLCALAVCIYATTNFTIQHFRDLSAHPVETTIELVPAESVEFPMVVVDTSQNLDPLGWIRKSGDTIAPETLRAYEGRFVLHRGCWPMS